MERRFTVTVGSSLSPLGGRGRAGRRLATLVNVVMLQVVLAVTVANTHRRRTVSSRHHGHRELKLLAIMEKRGKGPAG
ncbi:hypothetical protein E2562_003374 [Oryza meyeriana var. granulata]|uniref:Uncharacterized protein n=1 Tax=Oryza meyeriana var. granulata TaxID=110450 RepID=A0A6G1EED2_9ORYZ|nr:hypothetical protein E2562_003374 [Oryza meyeriana var. granulata]